ncbi:MAG TPA: HAD family hydrolase [Pirellulales bacterium]|jgi:phosphoglycolate phosphatase-like HAD superfamily hydrolase
MLNRCHRLTAALAAVLPLLFVGWAFAEQNEPEALSSWNDGPAKSAILNFVHETTDKSSAKFVPPEERIATFDQDGTLWCEHPVYTQVVFAIDRVKQLVPQHPDWKTTEPFKSILADDQQATMKFTIQDFAKVVAVSHTGMTVEEFQAIVKKWLATAEHPRFHRRYTDLVYQPMLEVMAYLRANGFKTYIVTGGGQDFVRVFSDQVYGVPTEQVVGSAGKTKYEYGSAGQPRLVKVPEILLIDDKTGKPEGINLFIGRRPIAAFGNSTGDQQMLEWTQATDDSKVAHGARLMMLVLHDDAQREYAYGPAQGLPDSKVGAFTEPLYDEAKSNGWTVISMKKDWKRVFQFEK